MRLPKKCVALFQNLHLLEAACSHCRSSFCDKPIFRFDSLIVVRGAVDFQPSTFQSMPPLLVEPQPVLLQIIRSLQAQRYAAGCSATMIFCVINSSSVLPDKDWQRGTSTSSLPVEHKYHADSCPDARIMHSHSPQARLDIQNAAKQRRSLTPLVPSMSP